MSAGHADPRQPHGDGPGVSWYRNIVAAGGHVIVFQNTQAGLRAIGYPRALILKAPLRNEFRHLRC